MSLLTVVGVFFAVFVLALSLLASQIAARIPFQYERELVERFDLFEPPESSPEQDWLESLVSELVVSAELPDDMVITVHYVDDDLVNAMATLGGHVFVFRGLIEALPSENALAMVIAHEIAHIQHRHPVLALGRVSTVGIAVAALSGVSGADLSSVLLNHVRVLTQLRFSRRQEREADASGLKCIIRHYGHASDADALFRIIDHRQNQPGESDALFPEIFSTHPEPGSRVSYIQEIIQQQALTSGPTRPIPNIFSSP